MKPKRIVKVFSNKSGLNKPYIKYIVDTCKQPKFGS
jgi:hypothetical protein